MICAKNHIKAQLTQRTCVREFGHVGVVVRGGALMALPYTNTIRFSPAGRTSPMIG